MKETREINTVVLRCTDIADVLVLEAEANLTHDELLQSLPADEPRLVVHELCFATPEGARRSERLLIFWMPPGAGGQEEMYTVGFTALKEFLTDVHVHLTARRKAELEYRRLVALAG
ncbi:cofilin family protein [Streptomyces sp. NPDC059874]|uniref:cofilin family protein n=1 Tax=Streptomyces sp. NPDC059874 TaxID=3346983 RepID=UPI0036509119